MRQAATVKVEATTAPSPPSPKEWWEKIVAWWNSLPAWQKIALVSSSAAVSVASIALAIKRKGKT